MQIRKERLLILEIKPILLHSTEKNLKEHGSKVSDADKKAIEDASANLRNALKGTDVEEIKKKTQDLVQASMKLGEAIYKSQQSAKPEDKTIQKKRIKKTIMLLMLILRK